MKFLKRVLKGVWSVISNKEYAPEEKALGAAVATSILLSIGASAGLVALVQNIISSLN